MPRFNSQEMDLEAEGCAKLLLQLAKVAGGGGAPAFGFWKFLGTAKQSKPSDRDNQRCFSATLSLHGVSFVHGRLSGKGRLFHSNSLDGFGGVLNR